MKLFKKSVLLFALVLLFGTQLNAQEHHAEKREKIEALKVAYITEKLALTEKEAQNFWPIYKTFQEQKKALHPKREKSKDGKRVKPNFDEMTDAEVEAFIAEHMKRERDMLALRQDFFMKAKTVLPIKKVAKLAQAERDFRHEVLKRMKERRK